MTDRLIIVHRKLRRRCCRAVLKIHLANRSNAKRLGSDVCYCGPRVYELGDSKRWKRRVSVARGLGSGGSHSGLCQFCRSEGLLRRRKQLKYGFSNSKSTVTRERKWPKKYRAQLVWYLSIYGRKNNAQNRKNLGLNISDFQGLNIVWREVQKLKRRQANKY